MPHRHAIDLPDGNAIQVIQSGGRNDGYLLGYVLYWCPKWHAYEHAGGGFQLAYLGEYDTPGEAIHNLPLTD